MKLSKQPYKGTRDLFPREKRLQNYLFDTMKTVVTRFGFEPYDGPLLEEVDLYLAKSGEEMIRDQIYSFLDRAERKVAIRPEMTPTLARMIAQIHRQTPKPIRWFSIPNLMRYEKPQRGRLREHWQLNCDIFGADTILGVVEIFQVLIALFEEFGANEKHFGIQLNDRKLIDALFEKLKLNDEEKYKLIKLIDRKHKISEEIFLKDLHEIVQGEDSRKQILQYFTIKTIPEVKEFIESLDSKHSVDLLAVMELMEQLDLGHYLEFEPSVVRGLDYYTGVVFELFDKHPDNRRALCGGGVYHTLLKIFGEQEVPGLGFGLGDVTLKDFLEVHKLLPNKDHQEIQLLIGISHPSAITKSFQMARWFRQHLNISVTHTLEVSKAGKIYQYAEKMNIPFVIVFDETEIQQKLFNLKNTINRSQLQLSEQDLEIKNLDEIKQFMGLSL